MINTFSAFYYGHEIDETNLNLGFKESGSEIKATLNVGSYSLTDFALEVARAMNEAGSYTYSAAVNRSTRRITITATGSFQLLAATSAFLSTSCYSLLGFSADTSSATSHTAPSASGFAWYPQMKIQNYVAFEDQQSSVDGTIKKTANGTVESVTYGNEYIMDANFMFITDIPQSVDWLKTDSSGVLNAREFLKYATKKNDLEFVADINSNNFVKCLLDKTQESNDGLAFKLKEMYGRGLPGYYETGILKFRLIE